MLLWGSHNPRQSLYDVLGRTGVTRIIPRSENNPVAWGRALEVVGAVALGAVLAGGLMWWGAVLAGLVAGHP